MKTGSQIKSGKALMPWRRLTVMIAFVCFVVVLAGRALDMQVVAEGVETEAQRDLLLGAGCDFAQGYHFSRAVPAHEFEALLNPESESVQPARTSKKT